MTEEFYKRIFEKHRSAEAIPSNKIIANWAKDLLHLLFPELSKGPITSIEELRDSLGDLEGTLLDILNSTKACTNCNNELVATAFFRSLPEIHTTLQTDVSAIFMGDPAAGSEFEVVRAYPGFFAIAFYRIAHQLNILKVPLLPRILTEYAHSKTGIDIHPAAEIGEYFHIDHGTGIVIGETCSIGKHVKLYQGVTLGALSVDKKMAHTKRHPTIQDHVVIYSGATILGGETVVGHDSTIGGNVWLTQSVPPGSAVYNIAEVKIAEGKNLRSGS